MIQSPVAETPNQKQILKGTKQENKANILGGKNLNKDDNSKDGEIANMSGMTIEAVAKLRAPAPKPVSKPVAKKAPAAPKPVEKPTKK